MSKNQNCYVCGFDIKKDPWRFDHHGTNIVYDSIKPWYMCPCCGFHYNIDDFDKGSIMDYRKDWIENDGCKFFHPEEYGIDWNIETAKKQFEYLSKNVQLEELKIIENEFYGYVERVLNRQSDWSPKIDLDKLKEYWK